MNKKQITIVTAIIRDGEGRLLLSQRNEPSLPHAHAKWQFIGGGINFGEDPEVAIIREVKEEAGLEVKATGLLPKIFTHVWEIDGRKDQIIILSYECEIISGTPIPSDAETGDVKYFTVEEIMKLDTLPQIKEAAELFSKVPPAVM